MDIYNWLEERNIVCDRMKLVDQALVHSSYLNEHKQEKQDNERLEFMGDAVLQLWVSNQLMHLEKPLSEGKMTTIRAQLVCEEALANYARELGLNQYLKLGVGEEKSGGRNRNSICADMFEALLGALYLEMGMSAIDNILNEVISVKLKSVDQLMTMDYKTKLQEYVQADLRKSVTYEVIRTSGPSNRPEFEVQVVMDGIILGKGIGNSKKKAEQSAAQNAFDKMVR